MEKLSIATDPPILFKSAKACTLILEILVENNFHLNVNHTVSNTDKYINFAEEE